MAARSQLLITPPFITNFPFVWKTRPAENGGYEVCALFTEPAMETDAWKDMVSAITEVGKEEFGSAFNKDFIEKLRAKERFCIRDAGEKSGEWKEFEPGRKFMNMKRSAEDGRPEIVDMQFNDILDESLVYAGVICRAGVRFRAYDNKWGQGVSCYFEHLQLMKTGMPRLDNRISAKKMFQGAPEASDQADEVLKAMGIEASSSDESAAEDSGI